MICSIVTVLCSPPYWFCHVIQKCSFVQHAPAHHVLCFTEVMSSNKRSQMQRILQPKKRWLWCVVLCRVVSCCVVLCRVVSCCVVLCCVVMLCYIVKTQQNTTEHNTTEHNTTQHNTTQHNTTQHNTTQHRPVECLVSQGCGPGLFPALRPCSLRHLLMVTETRTLRAPWDIIKQRVALAM